eukprot:4890668-Prymnesium_polylepis.1
MDCKIGLPIAAAYDTKSGWYGTAYSRTRVSSSHCALAPPKSQVHHKPQDSRTLTQVSTVYQTVPSNEHAPM